jgi:hypothetical protein
MNKNQIKSILTESANHPKVIHGIFNWCDRWCERCSKTENCTVFKTSAHLPSDNPDVFFKNLSMMFDATIDMMKEYCEKNDIDFESLKDSDIECEYERKKVIQWYQYLLQVKMQRALMAQKDETELELNPYDSLGNAKLLLVSIERNIGAWGYLYQKFREDEDEILDILVCLQNLGKKLEQLFPDARTFIRPGLDELLKTVVNFDEFRI